MGFSNDNKKIGILWENSDKLRLTFQPDRFLFTWFDLEENNHMKID